MKFLPIFTLLACTLLASPAWAAITGAELLKRCNASEKSMSGGKMTAEETLDSMWCVGYISGLLDGFGVSDFRVGEVRMVCPGEEGITRSQALGIITGYLNEHPDDLPKSGRRSALLALAKALPCKKAGTD